MNIRSRAWCFTVNNYTDADVNTVNRIQCDYIVYGFEKAPTTGTKHIQGYLYFKSMKSFNQIKSMLPNQTHIERARGSSQKNKEYCTKEGEWIERGEIPKQGKRNDLEDCCELIKEKRDMKVAIEEYPEVVAKYPRGIATIYNYYKKPTDFHRKEKRKVIWLYGDAGVGKTYRAKEIFKENGYKPEDVYLYTSGSKEFINGFQSEKGALLDDFRHDQIPFAVLLKMLDPWNDCTVNTKGGFAWWMCDLVVITCVKSPQEEFRGIDEDLNQLLRRVEVRRIGESHQTDLNNQLFDSQLDQLPTALDDLIDISN